MPLGMVDIGEENTYSPVGSFEIRGKDVIELGILQRFT